MTSDSSETDPGARLELYVRSLLPSGAQVRQETVIERIERLEERGAIEGFTVKVWGQRMDASSAAARTEIGQLIQQRMAEFTEWAQDNDISLRACFDSQEIRSSITGDEYTAVVLPVMVLAEFRGEAVRFVAPCTDGERVYTVADLLNTFDADGGRKPEGKLPQARAVRPGAPPGTDE